MVYLEFDFSIIVPIYNGEIYLNRCVDSIILAALGYKVELILVNDGSTDDSVVIAQNYSNKFPWIKIVHQENKGPSAARNSGLDIIQGRYVGFVDCDDCIANNYFSKLAIVCESNPDIVVFGYEKILLSGKHNIFTPKLMSHSDESEELLCNVNKDRELFWFSATKLFKSKLIASIRFDETMRLGEDTIFNLKAVMNAKEILRIDCSLYFYYEVASSLSSSTYKYNLLKNMEKHFSSRIAINEKTNRGLDEVAWNDIYNYYIFHIIPWLFSNSMHLNKKQQIKELKEIRNSNFVKKCYAEKYSFGRNPRIILMHCLFRVKAFKSLQIYLLTIFSRS